MNRNEKAYYEGDEQYNIAYATECDSSSAADGIDGSQRTYSGRNSAFLSGVGEDDVGGGGGGEQQSGGDGRNVDNLIRVPSASYLPPPPRQFALKSGAHRSSSAGNDGKEESKQLQIQDDRARSDRPGVMRVRVENGRVDIEFGPSSGTTTELIISRQHSDEHLFGGDPLGSPSSGHIMTQAELVKDAAIATPDSTTSGLRYRVEMLEGTKNGLLSTTRNRILCGLMLLALMGGSIGLIVFLVATNKGDAPTDAPSLSPSIQPSMNPTTSPSQFPSSLPTIDVEELWTALIQSKSPETTFDNENSPEYKAMDWMVSDPFTKSLFNDTDRVIQRFVLAVFWYATDTILGRGWLSDTAECTWDVSFRCDANDRLVALDISELRTPLGSTLPKELGLLSSSLTLLSLFDCGFGGTIPTEIGKLTNLQFLDLSLSMLNGGATIPSEIGLLTRLTALGFAEMGLEGTIPTEVGMLSWVEIFLLFENHLAGTVPSEIGLMGGSIQILDLAGNHDLIATIPSEVAQFNKLEHLHLYSTGLTGTIPSSLCDEAPRERFLSIDCDETIECTCCVGPWPGFVPCEDDNPTS